MHWKVKQTLKYLQWDYLYLVFNQVVNISLTQHSCVREALKFKSVFQLQHDLSNNYFVDFLYNFQFKMMHLDKNISTQGRMTCSPCEYTEKKNNQFSQFSDNLSNFLTKDSNSVCRIQTQLVCTINEKKKCGKSLGLFSQRCECSWSIPLSLGRRISSPDHGVWNQPVCGH